jgi:hypothetical protein
MIKMININDTSFLPATKKSREEVSIIPLTVPKQEPATRTGIIHASGP